MVFISYSVVGVLGYIGFMGKMFDEHLKLKNGIIEQNCLDMFEPTSAIAFLLRITLFCLLMVAFPLVNHFLRTLIFTLIWGTLEVPNKIFLIVNTIDLSLPLLFAIVYPQIGKILSYVGSVAGLFIIYIIPVVAYLKMYKT